MKTPFNYRSNSANAFGEYLKKLQLKEEIIEDIKKNFKNFEGVGNGSKRPSKSNQGSARQVALAFYYMQNSDIAPNSTGTTIVDARCIQFLTGCDIDTLRKNYKDPKKKIRNETEGKATKDLISDLIKIRSQFEKIMFNKGIEKISKDIDTLNKDLNSFKSH